VFYLNIEHISDHAACDVEANWRSLLRYQLEITLLH